MPWKPLCGDVQEFSCELRDEHNDVLSASLLHINQTHFLHSSFGAASTLASSVLSHDQGSAGQHDAGGLPLAVLAIVAAVLLLAISSACVLWPWGGDAKQALAPQVPRAGNDSMETSSCQSSPMQAPRSPSTATAAKQFLVPCAPRVARQGGSCLRLLGRVAARRPQNAMLEVEQAHDARRVEVTFRFLFTEGSPSAGVLLECATSRTPLAVLDTRPALCEEGFEGPRFVRVFLHALAAPAAHLLVEAAANCILVRAAVPGSVASIPGGSAHNLALPVGSGALQDGASGQPLYTVRFAKEGLHACILDADNRLVASMQATKEAQQDTDVAPVASKVPMALRIAEGIDEVPILCMLIAALKLR